MTSRLPSSSAKATARHALDVATEAHRGWPSKPQRAIRSQLSPISNRAGLTLLELLLGMTVLMIIMIAIGTAMGTMQNTWSRVRQKADTYRSTRMALESMSRRIAAATLATRMVPNEAALTSSGSAEPVLRPESDLHFVAGPVAGSQNALDAGRGATGHAIFFQAPMGEPGEAADRSRDVKSNDAYNHLTSTMCSWGYFVSLDEEHVGMPKFLAQDKDVRRFRRKRFRLMEFRQPADELSLYRTDDQGRAQITGQQPPTLYNWFSEPLGKSSQRPVAVVAENVIAVFFHPFDPARGQTISSGIVEDIRPFQITRQGLYDTRRALWDNAPAGTGDPDYIYASLHHLPPGIRMTVVATSEDSWLRLLAREGEGLVNSAAEGLRSMINGRFHDAATFTNDLSSLEARLNEMRLDYRIFTTDIRLSEQ